MQRIAQPILAGILCATCWTVWTGAVAAKNPWLTTLSEFGLLGVGWMTWGWIREKQNLEWWTYAVTSAIASGVVVWLT